jgi:hypothetical protein
MIGLLPNGTLRGAGPLTRDDFRALALGLPESVEGSHMDHPDFRVRGKVFASLHPKEEWGMVKLTPEQQKIRVEAEPEMFVPVSGAWGARGATYVVLKKAKKPSVRLSLMDAWRNTAPKPLIQALESRS